MRQEMKLEFDSIPSNESFARVVVAAFLTRLNPTMEEVADIKTAISEAVTNAIIHGYNNEVHKIEIVASVEGEIFTVSVRDFGVGIEDIAKAMEPLYTTRRDLERSGMGFVFMEAFMDTIRVESKKDEGTKVTMTKKIGRRYEKQG
ncbi:MAG: anti-sigma F factor [Lachnospiraceae bacterium]|nr:anti-sigma F factor [Lachnospiraceae bacterium]